LAADILFPEWKVWTQFLDDFTMGLRLDALAMSHPIEVNELYLGPRKAPSSLKACVCMCG